MQTVYYSSYRDNIKNGDPLIWTTDTISNINDAILMLSQKILKSNYSHIGIALNLGGRVLDFEANVPEVKLKPLSLTRDFYHMPLNIDWKDDYFDFLFKELGKIYSLYDIIKFLLRFKTSQDNWYCSEIAAYFYKHVGIIKKERYGITPIKLIEELIKATGIEPVRVILDTANLVRRY